MEEGFVTRYYRASSEDKGGYLYEHDRSYKSRNQKEKIQHPENEPE